MRSHILLSGTILMFIFSTSEFHSDLKSLSTLSMSLQRVEVTILVASVSSPNVSVYVVNPVVWSQCNCKDCFAVNGGQPPVGCDGRAISNLQNTPGRIITTHGGKIQVEPGEYYFLVTTRSNNIERAVWSTRRTISPSDHGRTINL